MPDPAWSPSDTIAVVSLVLGVISGPVGWLLGRHFERKDQRERDEAAAAQRRKDEQKAVLKEVQDAVNGAYYASLALVTIGEISAAEAARMRVSFYDAVRQLRAAASSQELFSATPKELEIREQINGLEVVLASDDLDPAHPGHETIKAQTNALEKLRTLGHELGLWS